MKEKLTADKALDLLEKLVKTGKHPVFDTPEAFSKYLCKFWLPSVTEDESAGKNNQVMLIENAMPWQGGSGNYQKAFRRYMSIVAPDGVFAARGTFGLPITSVEDVKLMLDAWMVARGDAADAYESYSMNIAKASAHFAQVGNNIDKDALESILGRKILKRRNEKDQRDIEDLLGLPPRPSKIVKFKSFEQMIADVEKSDESSHDKINFLQGFRASKLTAEYIKSVEKRALTEQFVEECAKKVSSSILIVGKIALKYLVCFGGDSESGVLNEAELHVSPKCASKLDCAQHIYVLCPFKLNLPKATEGERKKFCLSYYQESRAGGDFLLHPSVKCNVFDWKLVSKPPATHTWYRYL